MAYSSTILAATVALAAGCTTGLSHDGSGGSGTGGSTNSSSGGSGGSASGAGGATGPNGAGGGAVTGTGGARTTGSGGITGNGGATSSGGATGGAGISGSGGAAMCANAVVSATAAAQLSAAYQSWKATFIMDCTANNSAVVLNGSGVVSEGIGYGMLLAAANNDQPLFDKLWKFYSDHLDPQGLMNWAMDACAPPGNNNANSATDADLDVAMALVQADAAWGGYAATAKTLIGKIKQSETDSCNGLNVLRPGDKFGGCSDPNNMGKVNPSYFAPGYYRVFALVDTANAAFWTKLAADSYTLLAQYQATMGGLVPEWGFVNGTTDGSSYGYNACRTPWRVAVDFLWFCTPEARTFLQGISSYVDAKGGVANVPFDKNSAFLGAFALSAMPLGQSKLDAYISSWLGAQVSDQPYFQATLRRLYLHAAAGQFVLPVR